VWPSSPRGSLSTLLSPHQYHADKFVTFCIKAKLVFPYNNFDEILALEQETSPFLNLTFTPFKEDIIKTALFGL
jgi:hypothetical protein